MRYAVLLLVCLSQLAFADDWLYLTYPGDTPLKIGHEYLKNPSDWKKILEINHVRNQYVLPVHTRIRIPVELLKVTPAPALVTHVSGNVRVRPEGGVFKRLATGDKLTGGETVITGPNSFVSFKLADGSKLSEQASSKLKFARLAAYGKTGMVATELDLQTGRMEAGASKQIGPAGGFRVVTPVAVAGLRGTSFRLNVSEDQKFLRNEVLEGTVGVSAQQKEVLVAKGEGTVTEQGKPPEPPRPLLPAPDIAGLPDRTVALPLAFTWPGMKAAKSWRAQVATDPGFLDIRLDGTSDTPHIAWQTDLPDGHYYLRIRAIDSAGLEGLNADHPFELDARPLPPAQLQPKPDERLFSNEATFTWAAAPEAQGYLLQISADENFPAGHTIERKLDAVLQDSEKLADGPYFWRIASLDENGPHGWSPVRAFLVQPPPGAPPAKAATRADLGLADFAWQATAHAARYDLQVSRSADFATLEAEKSVTGNQASVTLDPGRHFWRLRAVESNGLAGAWGPASPLVMPPAKPTDVRVDVSGGILTVRWQGNSPAYRLVFARDPDFKTLAFSHRQVGNEVHLATPKPGKYWVKVIALDKDEQPGGASQPVSFSSSILGWW